MRVEESSVIRRAQSGDQRAFQQLLELHHALVWRTACAFLGDSTAAQEVEQEAWLDDWRGLASISSRSPFRPWLLTVVANRSRKHTRQHTIAPEPLDESLLNGGVTAGAGIAHVLRSEQRQDPARARAALPLASARSSRG
jgi:RNA polymerase sigma-70 factor (ECF subfamily)